MTDHAHSGMKPPPRLWTEALHRGQRPARRHGLRRHRPRASFRAQRGHPPWARLARADPVNLRGPSPALPQESAAPLRGFATRTQQKRSPVSMMAKCLRPVRLPARRRTCGSTLTWPRRTPNPAHHTRSLEAQTAPSRSPASPSMERAVRRRDLRHRRTTASSPSASPPTRPAKLTLRLRAPHRLQSGCHQAFAGD